MNFAEGFYILMIIIGTALAIIYIAGAWKMYQKAGKPGWAVLIPIYDVIVLLEFIGKPVWWLFLLLIPGVNVVIWIIMNHALSKVFGKDVGFTLGLLFLGFIFIPILGFGSATYTPPAAED